MPIANSLLKVTLNMKLKSTKMETQLLTVIHAIVDTVGGIGEKKWKGLKKYTTCVLLKS